MPPKKKIGEAKLREMAEAEMLDFSLQAERRYVAAQLRVSKQDEPTRDAVERMTSLLCRIARKQMWFGVGKREDRIVLDIPDETVYHNMFYLASEILKDLALMDIRIEGYTFPADVCAECGTEIKPTKKKVKNRG